LTAATEYQPLDHSRSNARVSKELQILDTNINYIIQEDNFNTWEEYKIIHYSMAMTQKKRYEG
jgi:hypothetical protein